MRQVLFFLLTLTSFVLLAQNRNSFGFLPSINLNKKLPKDWSVNFKSEFRQNLYEEVRDYEYIRTDLSLIIGKKTGIHSAIAGGYQRILEATGSQRHRYIQQFNLITPTRSLTLGHRFSSDQTFSNVRDTEVRFRYRLSTEIPLNGTSVDVKEFFLKLSNEYVNGFQSSEYDLEIRWLGFLGLKIGRKTKLELGVDYRMDSFITEAVRNRAWVGLNLFHSM